MAAGVFGYFRFRLENGNLAGIWLNNSAPDTGTETAIRNVQAGEDINAFAGQYAATWRDPQPQTADLVILPPVDNIFVLTWTNPDFVYTGRGILEANGDLAGYYELI